MSPVREATVESAALSSEARDRPLGRMGRPAYGSPASLLGGAVWAAVGIRSLPGPPRSLGSVL